MGRRLKCSEESFVISLSFRVIIFYYFREHAMLAKTAGVKHLVILVNKMDDPTVEWDKERYLQSCCS